MDVGDHRALLWPPIRGVPMDHRPAHQAQALYRQHQDLGAFRFVPCGHPRRRSDLLWRRRHFVHARPQGHRAGVDGALVGRLLQGVPASAHLPEFGAHHRRCRPRLDEGAQLYVGQLHRRNLERCHVGKQGDPQQKNPRRQAIGGEPHAGEHVCRPHHLGLLHDLARIAGHRGASEGLRRLVRRSCCWLLGRAPLVASRRVGLPLLHL
mmetsp:Transcript_108936/g.351591  ORF Transcript_108936/g.351591 Transcript_108936/m.351591 type:complete len:208 (-) Transcript_108936:451-1074(-)